MDHFETEPWTWHLLTNVFMLICGETKTKSNLKGEINCSVAESPTTFISRMGSVGEWAWRLRDKTQNMKSNKTA